MDLKGKIKNIPQKSGVYLMKNIDDKIIYIGKAKNLKKRVSSYFYKTVKDSKTNILINNSYNIETIITDNEIEALILESNLIKKYKPKYNIELKDNKKYPFIKITDEEYPKISKTRNKNDPTATYFGPYPNVKYVNRTIKTITDLFPIRRCNKNLNSSQKYSPCLNFYLGKCVSPCSQNINEEDYKKLVEHVILFLEGNNKQLLRKLKKNIEQDAKNQKFEQAIKLRERYKALKNILEEQKITTLKNEDEDIIGLDNNDIKYTIVVLIKREGKIIGKKNYDIESEMGKDEVLGQFLDLFYENNTDLPKEILLPFEIEDIFTLTNYFKMKYRKIVKVYNPKKGLKKKLVNLACKNAFNIMREKIYKYNPSQAILYLKDRLNLKKDPINIEAFDIATILGNYSVASMVSFKGGIPDKKNYRRFRIRYVNGQNDVEMMKEVVARRYQRLLNEKKPFPDLVLVDGGMAQINGTKDILTSLGIDNISIIGIAKRNEELYTYGKSTPLILEKNNEALRLLMAIRDEAHRFANAYHVNLRDKESIKSKLKDIPGIGNNLIKRILASLENIDKTLTIKNIKKIKGLGDKKAREVYEVLKQ